jgi:hypothetical protein
MTEELEKKLNELLGLKKQIEELTTDKKKSDLISAFDKGTRKIKIYFYLYLAAGVVIAIAGITGMETNTGNHFIALFVAIVGFETTVLIKMWYHTMTTKLTILQEIKQLELRITEMLNK